MSKHNNFLNSRRAIQLPSNLLSLNRKKNSNNEMNNNLAYNIEDANGQSLQLRNNKILDKSNRYYNTIQTPTFMGQKNNNKEKQVLYKRLSNIRGDNKQIGNLSFSKMLSRMVVLDDQEEPQNSYAFQPKMRQTIHANPVPQKLYNLNCGQRSSRAPSRSIDLQQIKKPSRRLFKKFYLPSSQITQTFYRQTGNPSDKYIYREGKKIQCKRIHNFYTSHMFRNGYDKCFRKTVSSFKTPL